MSVVAGQTRLMNDGTRVYVMKVGPEKLGQQYEVELLLEDGPARGQTIYRNYGTVMGYPRADLPRPKPPEPQFEPDGLQYRMQKAVDEILEMWEDQLAWYEDQVGGFVIDEDGDAVFRDGTKVYLDYGVKIAKPCACEEGVCLKSKDLLDENGYYCTRPTGEATPAVQEASGEAPTAPSTPTSTRPPGIPR